MLEKIKGLIKRHIVLFILCVIALIAIIVMLIFFLKMSINTSSKYGDRLDGIEKVELSKKDLSKIKEKIKENEEVSSAKVRVQGKIVYIDISYKEGTDLAKAKEIANATLDNFEDDEKAFYDFEFVINEDSEKDDAWASIGAKNSSDSEIIWTKS